MGHWLIQNSVLQKNLKRNLKRLKYFICSIENYNNMIYFILLHTQFLWSSFCISVCVRCAALYTTHVSNFNLFFIRIFFSKSLLLRRNYWAIIAFKTFFPSFFLWPVPCIILKNPMNSRFYQFQMQNQLILL